MSITRPIAGLMLLLGSACSATNDQGLGTEYAPGGTGGGGGSGGGGAGGAFLDGSTLPVDSGGTPINPDSACLSETYGAQSKPAYLMIQVDVSGSMNCAPQDTGCGVAEPFPGSRWEVFKAKLDDALGALPGSSGAGLMHYPTGKGTFSGDPTGCIPKQPDVPLGELTTNAAAISVKLDSIVPAGGTPTHDGVLVALGQLQSASVPGNKFLVLATDGQATFCAGCDLSCSSDALEADNGVMIQQVAAAAAAGIRTFVLGAPGSNNYRSVLSKLASAGGTPSQPGCSDTGPVYCHYDMTTAPDFGQALEAALKAVGGAALGCVYDIPTPDGSFDKNKVNVQLSSDGQTEQIPRDPSQQDGWDYSADGTQIILYGGACEDAKAAMNGKIDILYGCPTIIK